LLVEPCGFTSNRPPPPERSSDLEQI
jgi:hypothetical protein